MKQLKMVWLIGVILITSSITNTVAAQNSTAPQKNYVPVSQALFDTILHMDSLLFGAFNKRDFDAHIALFSTDVEFYHDKGGLSKYSEVVENTKRLFAQNNDLARTLIPGSMEVYPIKDYGAVQIAEHRFCHTENGKNDCGTFKFVHIWHREPNGWKLARVISYDH